MLEGAARGCRSPCPGGALGQVGGCLAVPVPHLVRSEAALLLLLLLDSESELLRGRLQSLRYTRKLFFTGWFPLLKPLAGRSAADRQRGSVSYAWPPVLTPTTDSHRARAATLTHGRLLSRFITVAVRAGALVRALSYPLPLPL